MIFRVLSNIMVFSKLGKAPKTRIGSDLAKQIGLGLAKIARAKFGQKKIFVPNPYGHT